MATRDVTENMVLSEQDTSLMANLLREYNTKVGGMTERLEKLRLRSMILAILAISLLSGLATAAGMVSPREFARSILKSGTSNWLSVAFLFALLLSVYVRETYRRSRKVLLQELRILSSKLEYLVRAASQTEEHGVRDGIRRIELDLLLAESEAVLRHVATLVR